MDRLAVVLLALAAAAPGLSGCLGEAPTAPSAPTRPEDAVETARALPDNRSGELAALQETNATEAGAGGERHRHDHWGGRSRMLLFETRVAMEPAPDGAAGAVAVARPPPPALVHEGTATVEVTLRDPARRACAPWPVANSSPPCGPDLAGAAPPQGLALSFLHAASDPDAWTDAGTAAWGAPLAIRVGGPEWTDMPHSVASLWALRLASREAADATLTFVLAVEIVRGEGEIAEWPGHPDFYRHGHARPIYDGAGESRERIGDEQAQSRAVPARLISSGTRTLHVWVNITSVEAVVPPTHWALHFHNASHPDGWLFTDPFNDTYASGQASMRWVLPVDDGGMDSPYATLSRWEFLVRGAYTSPTADTPLPPPYQRPGVSCIYGCSPSYVAKYNLAIVATDVVEAEYSRTTPL